MTQPSAGAAGGSLGAVVDALSAALVAQYAAAEQHLIEQLAEVARKGMTDTTLSAQSLMASEMRRAAERLATALSLRSEPLARQLATEAAQHGDAAAQLMLRRIVGGDPRLARQYLAKIEDVTGHGLAAALSIGLELASKLDQTRSGILRYANDAYRAAVSEASTGLVLGNRGLTPATAQNRAWQELTRQGVTGYTDTAGHRWNLATYVEMATRTAVQRSYNAAHLDRMTSVGIEYFTISHDGRPCPLCKPWEGAVLSLGRTGVTIEPDAATGQPVAFTVAGTLDEAIAAGLQHPNCKHVLLAYLPGVTKTTHAKRWTKADDERYAATQELRRLEREVRASKRQQLGALDDLTRTKAGQRVRRYQATIRDHIAAEGLVRRPRREQLNLGNRP